MAIEDILGLPSQALGWAESAAAASVVDVATFGGGFTDTKWLLMLASGRRLVLRWSDPGRWGGIGREHVRREALACQLLTGSALPVPQLVASDLGGGIAGGPAILMTWRPGRPRLDPLEPQAVVVLARSAVAVY